MVDTQDIEQALTRFTAELRHREGSRFHAAYLFGSRARRQERPDSDVDVAVVLGGPRGDFLTEKLAMADVAYDVMLETGVLVQPLPLWQQDWDHPEAHPNPRLVQNIRAEGVPL
jgi:antitoxin ChpS